MRKKPLSGAHEGYRSVAPAREVRAGRGGLLNLLKNLGQILEVVMQARVRVRQIGIAVPAVLGAGTVGDFTTIGRILC